MAETETDSGVQVQCPDLPEEILFSIASRLSCFDLLVFRSVCRSWHRSSPPPMTSLLSPFLPLVVPPSMNMIFHSVISAGAVFLLRAPALDSSSSQSQSQGPPFCLLFVDEFVRGKLWLRNPLSWSSVSERPCYIPNFLNLLDFHAVQVGKYYGHGFVTSGFDGVLPLKFSSQFLKVVVASNGPEVIVLRSDRKLWMLLNFGEAEGRWQRLQTDFTFDDIVDFQGKFFCLSAGGRVYSIEYDQLWRMIEVGPPIPNCGERRKRLVVSHGELYLVVRWPSTTFNVYKLRIYEDDWVQVNTLGGKVFFVGPDLSFSFSLQGIRGSDCILYTEYSFPCYHSMDGDQIFHPGVEKDDLGLGVFYLGESDNVERLGSPPIYSSILWPPPIWLQSNPKSNPLEALRIVTERFYSRIEGACKNSFRVGHCEKQFIYYAQFFDAMGSALESEINAAKELLLNFNDSHQSEMGGVNSRIQKRHDTTFSIEDIAFSTRIQHKVLENAKWLFHQAAIHFEDLIEYCRLVNTVATRAHGLQKPAARPCISSSRRMFKVEAASSALQTLLLNLCIERSAFSY